VTHFLPHAKTRRRQLVHLAMAVAALKLRSLAADEAKQTQEADMNNPRMPTLTGRLFWGDVHCGRGYRIQQNVFARHVRLLEPRDQRWASGTFGE